MTEAPLELGFTVACPPAHAFSVWAERTSLRAHPGGTAVTIVHSDWQRLKRERNEQG